MKRRILYVVLAMFIVFSNLPMTAYAAESVNPLLTIVEATATKPLYAGTWGDGLETTAPTFKVLDQGNNEITWTWEEFKNSYGAYGHANSYYEFDLSEGYYTPLTEGSTKVDFVLYDYDSDEELSRTTFDVQVVPNPVKSIKVNYTKSLIENYDGYWEIEDENGSSEIAGEFFYYDIPYDYINAEITYTDGTVKSYNYYDVIEKTGYELLINANQYENHFEVGENVITAEYMGHEAQLVINVVENPIESISVSVGEINEIDGQMCPDEEYDYELEDWVPVSEPYRQYNFPKNTSTITINYKDKTRASETLKISEVDYVFDSQVYIDLPEQSFDNPYVIGTEYTGTAEFMGVFCDFKFKVTPNPVKSISAKATRSLIENVDGYLAHHAGTPEYFEYDVYKTFPEITVEYIDGSKKTYAFEEILNMKGDICLSLEPEQSPENVLSAGEHTAYVTFSEKQCEYKFKIEDTIENIVITPTRALVANIDGWVEIEDGKEVFSYDLKKLEPEITITYKDKTQKTYKYLDLKRFTDIDFWFETEDNVVLGKNTAKAEVMNRVVEFEFNIVEEAPAKKLVGFEVIPETKLVENTNGDYEPEWNEESGYDNDKMYFYYYVKKYCSFTVKLEFSDGTVETYTGIRDDDIIGDNYFDVYDNQSYDNQFKVGKNKVTVAYQNLTCDVDLEVIANPYTKLEISGENELIVTLTKADGSTETHKAVRFDWNVIYFDSGFVLNDVHIDYDFNDEKNCYENFCFEWYYDATSYSGEKVLTSNTLKTNNWLNLSFCISNIEQFAYSIAQYADGYSEKFYNRSFKGIDSGAITGSEIDDLLSIISNCGYLSDYIFVDENGKYAIISVDRAKEMLSGYVDLKRVDIESSPMYIEETDSIKVYTLSNFWEPGVRAGKLEYKNGYFVYTADFDSYYTTKIFTLLIKCENGIFYVDSIDIHEEADHVYDAGVVTKESTCTAHGIKLFTCECGATRTEELALLPHTDVFGGTKDVHTKCSVCGATTSAEHDFTSKVIKEATATTKGVEELTCECGYTCQIETEIHELGEVKIEAAKTNEFSATVSDVDVKAKLELTANEKYLLSQGNDLKLVFKLDDLGVNVDTTEKKAIADALGGKKLGAFLDIQLVKQIGNYEGNVTKLGGEIKVSLELPAELINTDKSLERIYKILRYHEGDENKVTVLDATFDEATKTITFATDRFSTYAVVYEDVSAKDEVPDAGVISTSVIWFGAMAASGLGAIALSKKKKED